MYLDGLSDLGADNIDAKALPWSTAWRPDMGVIDGDEHWIHAAVAAREAFKQAGYGGPLDLDTWIPDPNFGGEGPAGRYEPHPHPEAIAFLKARGYTLKVADLDKGGQGTSYGSLWDSPTGNIVKMSGYDWTNKRSFMDKLVIGVLAGIATAGVASAVGAAASGAGAGGGAAAAGGGAGAALPTAAEIGAAGGSAAGAAGTAAATAIPSAAGLLPAAAAALPAVASGGGGAAATAATSAPSMISSVAKGITAVAPIIQKQQAIEAQKIAAQAQAQGAAQLPIAPPASMIQPLMATPTAGFMPSAGNPQYIPFQSSATPAWLIPAAIGGVGLLLALVMMNRPQPRRR